MLYQHGNALDLARERSREVERTADRHRLLVQRRDDVERDRAHGARALVARPLRAVATAGRSIADVACMAATRLEGRSA